MSIIEAIKADIEKTYEYKVGYADAKEDMQNRFDELLDKIEDYCDSRRIAYENKITGYEADVVDIADIRKAIKEARKDMKI